MSTTPREVDETLAALYQAQYEAEDKRERIEHSLLSMAGAQWYYRGRQRVTDMQPQEAYDIVMAELPKHADSEYGYGQLGIPGAGSWSVGQARDAIRDLDQIETTLGELHAEIDEHESRYTGWSRFFLVTSSPGHVHSSMHCSTCRPTTRFGWLPVLSGKSESDAVSALGPTLCTVCFPSAPVEYTEGKKLTQAQARKRLSDLQDDPADDSVTTAAQAKGHTMSNSKASTTDKAPAKQTSAKPKSKAKPVNETPAKERVQNVAAATEIAGLKVETRQNGKRHVIVQGKTLLAYVDPHKRGDGFSLEVADKGGYRRLSVASVAAAAKAVKTSKRLAD